MRRKIVLCCILSILLLALLGNLTYADSLTSHMEYTYAKALTLADRSTFDGYCGMCVGRQLQALGINTSYEGTNGNNLYDKYKAMTKTSGGYTVNCLPSTSYTLSQALNYINSNNTSGGYTYVAIGFQIGFGSDGQKYGHTLLIYSVNNGTVYYTESSGTSIRTRSISSFCSYYSSCTFEGAVWFTNGTADTEAPGIPTVTSVKNNGTQVTVNWNSVSNATGYKCEIRKAEDGFPLACDSIETSGTSCTISLAEGGTYYACVYAYNGSISSGAEWYIFGTPERPQISSISTNGDHVTINWYATEYTTYYKCNILKAEDGFPLACEPVETTETSCTIILPEGGTYYACVSACNTNGCSSAEWYIFGTPKRPEITDVKVTNTRVIIKWKETSTYTTHYICQIINKDTDKPVYDFVTTTTTECTFENLQAGSYYVCVTTYSSIGQSGQAKMSFEVLAPYTQSTLTKSGTIHTIQTTVYNVDTSCLVLAAGYKGDKLVTLAIKGYEQEALSFPLDGDFDTIKVMVWDNGDSMQNLCEAEVIPSSEWKIE